jgi:glycosyltransferase involved in cell wall biosynthesis
LNLGGAEGAMVELANHLGDSSHFNVKLICGQSGVLERKVSNKVELIVLGRSRVLSTITQVVRFLRGKKVTFITTMVHCNLLYGFTLKLMNALGLTNVKVIIRESTDIYSRIKLQGFYKYKLTKFLIGFIYQKVDTVVFPNYSLKNAFESNFGLKMNNLEVIYNSSDFCKNATPLNIEQLNTIKLINVGRVEKGKRVQDSIKLLSRLREKGYDITLDIVGDGQALEMLKLNYSRDLKESLSFKGYQSEPFLDYCSSKTVFILNSELEGMPNSLIQALANGFTAISTNCNYGPAEVFDIFNISKDWLYEVGDIDQLESLLIQLIEGGKEYNMDLEKARGILSKENSYSYYERII